MLRDRTHDDLRRRPEHTHSMIEDMQRCDDVDPLRILVERNREHQGLSASIAEVTTEPRLNISARGDPRDKIDAILQQSKDVRELVASRQVSNTEAR